MVQPQVDIYTYHARFKDAVELLPAPKKGDRIRHCSSATLRMFFKKPEDGISCIWPVFIQKKPHCDCTLSEASDPGWFSHRLVETGG